MGEHPFRTIFQLLLFTSGGVEKIESSYRILLKLHNNARQEYVYFSSSFRLQFCYCYFSLSRKSISFAARRNEFCFFFFFLFLLRWKWSHWIITFSRRNLFELDFCVGIFKTRQNPLFLYRRMKNKLKKPQAVVSAFTKNTKKKNYLKKNSFTKVEKSFFSLSLALF